MYVLTKDKVLTLLGGLVEGQSIRSLERMTGVHRDTIMRWHIRAGQAAQKVLDEQVRDLRVNYVQADELWTFIGQKNAPESHGLVLNGYKGEAWVFVAIDAESKLVISYALGHRDGYTALRLMSDVRKRIVGEFQLTTDGLRAYVDAAEIAFGADVHFGQLVKIYSGDECIGARPMVIAGDPKMDKISTSYIERMNLTTRMSVRRVARKTNAFFSKKSENLAAALTLHFAHYNLCRVHCTLKMTPAMAAGITDRIWTMKDLVGKAFEDMAARGA
jgi:IS1 family transposase